MSAKSKRGGGNSNMHATNEPRICPVKDCTVQLHDKRPMCPAHWQLVSAELRGEFWRWFRQSQSSPMFGWARAAAIAAAERDDRITVAAGSSIQQNLL